MSEKLNQQLEQQDLEAMADQLLAEDAAKAMEGRRGFGTWNEAYLDILHQLQDNKTLVLLSLIHI